MLDYLWVLVGAAFSLSGFVLGWWLSQRKCRSRHRQFDRRDSDA